MKTKIENFKIKANRVHDNKYNYDKSVYVNTSTKIEIVCPIHGSFWQTPQQHLKGNGCPKCGLISRANKRKMGIETFIKKAKDVHGDKFDYSKVEYVNSREKVCIICPKHGEFWQTPHSHLIYGCAKCSTEEVHNKQRFTTESFIEKAREIHGDKYDYSKVNYINGKNKVIIICPEHGEFEQNAHSHLSGYGCKKCSYEKLKHYQQSTTEEFIEKSKKIHGDKYDYSKSKYIGNKKHLCIICPKHGEFWQIPNTHLSGHGCPKCAKRSSQLQLFNRLNQDLNLIFDFDKRTEWLGQQSLDIYNETYHFAIEYNGKQHYEPIEFFGGEEYYTKICQLDKIKAKLCENNNCKLWTIKYNYTDVDYNNLLNEIRDYIKNKK